MKQFLEFLPVLIFVIVYFLMDIYYATAALMAAVSIQMLVYKVRALTIPGQLKMIFWMTWVFGGLTLIYQDKTFIQWKPTIINWLMAAALIGSQFFSKRNLFQRMLDSQLQLPQKVWLRLNFGWAIGIFAEGVANLYVVYNYSEAVWVSYKLIGGIGITLAFMGITIAYLVWGGHLNMEADSPVNAQKVEDLCIRSKSRQHP